MTYLEYKEEMFQFRESLLAETDSPAGLDYTERMNKAISLLEDIEAELFLGQTEVQPIKFHQLLRIYKLAKTFIEILIVVWPVIRELLKLFKK